MAFVFVEIEEIGRTQDGFHAHFDGLNARGAGLFFAIYQLQDMRDFTVFDRAAICARCKARQDIARFDLVEIALAKYARVRRRGPLFVKRTFDFDFVYANARSQIIHHCDFGLPVYEFLTFLLA